MKLQLTTNKQEGGVEQKYLLRNLSIIQRYELQFKSYLKELRVYYCLQDLEFIIVLRLLKLSLIVFGRLYCN